MVTTGSRRPSAGRRARARAPSGGKGIRPVVDRIGAVLQAPREQRTCMLYMYCTMHDAPREHLGTPRASLRYLLDARCTTPMLLRASAVSIVKIVRSTSLHLRVGPVQFQKILQNFLRFSVTSNL
jgi:hypothetical protein